MSRELVSFCKFNFYWLLSSIGSGTNCNTWWETHFSQIRASLWRHLLYFPLFPYLIFSHRLYTQNSLLECPYGVLLFPLFVLSLVSRRYRTVMKAHFPSTSGLFVISGSATFTPTWKLLYDEFCESHHEKFVILKPTSKNCKSPKTLPPSWRVAAEHRLQFHGTLLSRKIGF